MLFRSPFYQNNLRWNDWFRTVAGLRADFYRGRVRSDNALNSGGAQGHMISPKLSLIFGPWAKTEYFINYGRGFHSNDLRGATITVDGFKAKDGSTNGFGAKVTYPDGRMVFTAGAANDPTKP